MRRTRPGSLAVMGAYTSRLQISLAAPLATWWRLTRGQRRENFSEIELNGNIDTCRQLSRLDGIMAFKILPTHVADRAEVLAPPGGHAGTGMLPSVLSQEKVSRLINAAGNLFRYR